MRKKIIKIKDDDPNKKYGVGTKVEFGPKYSAGTTIEFEKEKTYKSGTTIEFEPQYKPGTTIDLEIGKQAKARKTKTKKIKSKNLEDTINSNKIIEFKDVTNTNKKTKQTNRKKTNTGNTNILDTIKKGAIIGGIGLSALLGNYLIKNCSNIGKNVIRTEFTQPIPAGFIAGAEHKDSIYFFKERDPLLIDLARKKEYINLENLSVDKDALYKTLNLLNQMNKDQFLKTTNLGGLYIDYARVDGEIDYDGAMRHLWNMKNEKARKELKNEEEQEIIFAQSEKVLRQYSAQRSKKTDATRYQRKIKRQIKSTNNDLTKNDYYEKFNHKEQERFMKNYARNLNEKTVMAYFLTEIFPDTNPGVNITYLNELLKKAGEEFLNYIPSLGDNLNSSGPGQLTKHTINETGGAPSINPYLSKKNQTPTNMEDIETTRHHISGSINNMIYNAELLMNTLNKNNQLKNFNEKFEELSKEKQKVLIAGYASSAHHSSRIAREAYTQYTQDATINNKGFENMHTEISPRLGRVENYYEKSIRNYLTLNEMKKQKMQLQ